MWIETSNVVFCAESVCRVNLLQYQEEICSMRQPYRESATTISDTLINKNSKTDHNILYIVWLLSNCAFFLIL